MVSQKSCPNIYRCQLPRMGSLVIKQKLQELHTVWETLRRLYLDLKGNHVKTFSDNIPTGAHIRYKGRSGAHLCFSFPSTNLQSSSKTSKRYHNSYFDCFLWPNCSQFSLLKTLSSWHPEEIFCFLPIFHCLDCPHLSTWILKGQS